jgi:hypothetical protein
MSITINGTTGIAGVDGSAGTPALQGNDTNTGIFFPAADTIAFAEGGVEVARFDSSGNLGIGTTSPVARLDVFASSQPVLRITSGQDFSSGGAADPFGSLQFFTTDPTGIGSRVVGNIQTIADTASAAPGGVLVFSTAATNAAATERARIDSSGNLLVGTTSSTNAGRITAASDSAGASYPIYANNTNTGSTSQIVIDIARNGTRTGSINNTNSSTAYSTSSDYRLKENVQPMTGALAKVSALKPCTYKWKADGSDGEGFIAHELQEVAPECVTGEKDAVDSEGKPVYQGIDTSFLVATLTAAIQELKAELDAIKAEVAALKGQA